MLFNVGRQCREFFVLSIDLGFQFWAELLVQIFKAGPYSVGFFGIM